MGAALFPWASVPLHHHFKDLPRFTERLPTPPPPRHVTMPFASIIKLLSALLEAPAPRSQRAAGTAPRRSVQPILAAQPQPDWEGSDTGRVICSGRAEPGLGTGQREAP